MLDTYDAAVAENLQPIEGGEEVLKVAKAAGYGTFVLSEGPFDAQETTLQRLGIRAHVDVLITSSRERLLKSAGLFARALEKIGCAPESVLFVGDSMERDIVPAREAGMHVLQLTNQPADGVPSIRGFTELTVILKGNHISGPGRRPATGDFSP